LSTRKTEASDTQTFDNSSAQPSESPTPKRGRPKGKRSDPDYEQYSVYLRRETHRRVKIRLLEKYGDKEISELAQELLEDWLRSET
jgi:hypothetical protein